jgi:hypothetical protein
MADITLTHSAVNSGTAVILYNTKVSLSWKNLNKMDPIPGKYDITENENAGFENPKITLIGNFDVDDIDTNELTQELLVNFATLRSTVPIVLSIPAGETPTYLKGRPTGGYETDGNQTMSNSINVVIDSFDISFDSGSELGRFWNYSIHMHEVI